MLSLTILMTAVVLFMIVAPSYATITDDRIELTAKESYVFKTYLKGDDIKIDSKNGIVTLTGTVAQESHRLLAIETVSGLPGVKSVDDRMEIKGKLPTGNSDGAISDRVKATLLFHRSFGDSPIEVFVKDGIVTLKGVASSEAKKALATEYTDDIKGVKGVKNEMTTKPDNVSTIAKVSEYVDDASITAQVKLSLMYHSSTSGLRTKVSTDNGVVTLTGKAKNAAERTLAALYANDINGVKYVINRMTVE